jgi:uncharacterized membrane protein YfcA
MTLIAAKHRQIDIRRGLLLAVFALIWITGGIVLGKVFIPENQDFFKGSAGIITIIIGILFVIKGVKSKITGDNPGTVKEDSRPDALNKTDDGERRHFLIYVGVALMAFHIGFLGIGGGMGYAISLMLFLSYPILKATGTAMLMTFCSTLFAAGCMFLQIPDTAFPDVDAQLLISMMVGLSMIGTAVGAKIAYSLTERQISFLIGGVVTFAGLLATIQKWMLQFI